MASLTLSEARNISNDLLVQGIIEDIVTNNQFFDLLPFVTFSGEAYRYTREESPASAGFVAVGGNIVEGKATQKSVLVDLTTLSGQVRLDRRIQSQLSDHNDQLATQISSMAKQLARSYMRQMVNGVPLADRNAAGGQVGFSGMAYLLDTETGNVNDIDTLNGNPGDPSQTLNKNGAAFTLEDLDHLVQLIQAGDQPAFLMMNAREERKLRSLIRAAGGTVPEHIMNTNLGDSRPRMHYSGIPVFVNNYISTKEMCDFRELDAPSSLIDISAATTAVITAAGADLSAVTLTDTLEMGRVVSIDGNDVFIADGRFSITASDDGLDTIDVTGQVYTDQVRNFAQVAVDPVALKDAVNAREGSALAVTDFKIRIAAKSNASRIYAGLTGEGVGISGLTTEVNSGIELVPVGIDEQKNEDIHRLVWYCSFLLYSRHALAQIKNVTPA